MYYNNLTLKLGLFSWIFKHKEDVIFRKSETELNQKTGFEVSYKIAGTCGSWLQRPPYTHTHTHSFSLWCRPVCYVMNFISLNLYGVAATMYTTFFNLKISAFCSIFVYMIFVWLSKQDTIIFLNTVTNKWR